MSKIIRIPSKLTEYELRDEKAEVIILHKNMKRFHIIYAPSLKKIINFSDYIVMGPAEVSATIPVLNRAKKLNEIITF